VNEIWILFVPKCLNFAAFLLAVINYYVLYSVVRHSHVTI